MEVKASRITSLQYNQDKLDFRFFNEANHQIFENVVNGDSEISGDMDH